MRLFLVLLDFLDLLRTVFLLFRLRLPPVGGDADADADAGADADADADGVAGADADPGADAGAGADAYADADADDGVAGADPRADAGADADEIFRIRVVSLILVDFVSVKSIKFSVPFNEALLFNIL